MVVELKMDQSAESALAQIKERRYVEALSDLKGCDSKVLMVGVNYDKETKEHTDETTVKTRTYSEKELHTVCGSFYVACGTL